MIRIIETNLRVPLSCPHQLIIHFHTLKGHFTFCPMSSLPSSDQVIIGVELDHSELSSRSQHNALPGPGIPNDLIEAWGEQVDNPATADVRFNLSGHFVYANSAILSQRCRYLKYMFEEEWAPDKNQSKRDSVDSVRSFQGRPSKYKYLVDINDFHHKTFMEMLRFLVSKFRALWKTVR